MLTATSRLPKRAKTKRWWLWILIPCSIVVVIGLSTYIIRYSLDSFQNRLSKAERLYEENDFGEALVAFKKASDLGVNDPRVLCGLAKSYAKLKRYDDAIPVLRSEIHQYPNNIEGYLVLADIYKSLLDYATAQATITEAIRLNPTNVDLYIESGSLYYLAREFESSMGMYEKALELAPYNAEAHKGSAMAKLMIDRMDQINSAHNGDDGFDYEQERIETILDASPAPSNPPPSASNE